MNGFTLLVSTFHLLFVRFQLPHSHHYLSELALIKTEKYFLLPSTTDTFLSLPHLVSGQFLNLFRSPSLILSSPVTAPGFLPISDSCLSFSFPKSPLYQPQKSTLSLGSTHTPTHSHGFNHYPCPDGSLIRILSSDLLHKLLSIWYIGYLHSDA